MLPLTKRQREILDFLNDFIQQHGYAPSLEEIGRRFSLSSLATVHKHLTNLQEKGFIKRAWNRSRSVEVVPARLGSRAVELPMLGYVAAGSPIEAVVGSETIAVPEDLVGKRDTYVLRVKGDSMIDEQIRDGDFVIVEDRRTADNGEMVIALLHGSDVTLKKLYRENGRIRLQPANPAMQPILAAPDQVQVQGVVVGVMRGIRVRFQLPEFHRVRVRGRFFPLERWNSMSERKQINFTIVPDDTADLPRTYANFCAISHTPFDFTLAFCEVLPLSERDIQAAEAQHVVRAPVRSKIVVPLQVVPNLIAALQEHMRVYSESTGNTWDAKGPVH